MQRVRLLGELGERYGTEHTYYNLRTPADAIKLLCINMPELQQELMTAHERGIGYRVLQADQDMGYSDLRLPLGQNDLVLVPVIAGSGRGAGQILAGIGLVAFSILTAGAGAGFLGLGLGATAGTFTLGAAASSAIGAIGLSLAIGGVAQMLSPQPQLPSLGNQRFGSGTNASTRGPQSLTRGADGQQSYAYTGAANTVGVGQTIPVAYGKVLIGSQLLSANVEVTDESDPLQTAIRTPSSETIRIGGDPVSWGYADVQGISTRRTEETSFPPKSGTNRYNLYYDIRPLSNGAETKYLFDTKNDDRGDFCVCLGLPVGLRDRVAGAGTTLVDGFITYRVSVTRKRTQDLLGSVQATIQGLTLNHYRWIHKFAHAQNPSDDAQVRLEIIDFRCEGDVYIQLQAAGYLF
jgi:predicted phage tail protein